MVPHSRMYLKTYCPRAETAAKKQRNLRTAPIRREFGASLTFCKSRKDSRRGLWNLNSILI